MEQKNLCKECKHNDSLAPYYVYCLVLHNYLHVGMTECLHYKKKEVKDGITK